MIRTSIDSNGRLVAEVIRQKARRAPEAWRAASQRMGEKWLAWIKLLSSVQYASLAQLRQMGHPYARRQFAGMPGGARRMAARSGLPMPAYYINLQSGRLYEGWNLEIREGGNEIAIRITNEAPYFRFLARGTGKMISRPILDVALARASGEFSQIYTEAQMRVHGLM